MKVVALVVVAMTMALPASAHSGPAQKLRRLVRGDASAQWQSRTVDSPLDANRGRMRLEVAAQSGDDFINLHEVGSGVRAQSIASVRNLSFDFLSTGDVGARSPRIEVRVDQNGDGTTDLTVFLIASQCSNPIGGSIWNRADFTGERGAGLCSIRTSASPTLYTSDGTQSAWDVFVDAHGLNDQINDARVVAGGEVGVNYVDNIAFHNHAFGRGPNVRTGRQFIEHCPNEAAC